MKPESSLSSEDAFEEGEDELQIEATLEEDDTDKEDDIVDINNEDTSVKQRDWRRVRKTYERSKQYVFVAATLPVNGKKTAGGILKYMFPDAEWVCGNYLHCHNPRFIFLSYYQSRHLSFSHCYSAAPSETLTCIFQELE